MTDDEHQPMTLALALAILRDHQEGLHEETPRVDPHACAHPRCEEAYWFNATFNPERT